MPDGFTTLREITNFTKWGSVRKRKIFETYTLGMPVYSLTDGYGLDSSFYQFDFGYTVNSLRGCVINGIAYGDTVLSVENNENVPMSFVLYQNYPNPFNPSTTISWQSPVGSRQTIKIFDILGREVATLVDEYKEAGFYKIEFNSAQVSRTELASGVYFYRLQAGNFVETKKMMLLK
ncbi:MAG: T9SS type A sorting domain-containing protein [Ignavibacterium sp.]|nr:T9SS type A sorting domain-containing protein [Ignavibacterium sp.]